MATSYDEKGKFFTNVISKTPIEVIIQTTSHRISGKIHVCPEDRLKDEMNQADPFLAITDAVIESVDGKVLYRAKFVTIHRDHVIWILPVNEIERA